MAARMDLFWAKVDRSGECWVWTGAKCPSGYGHLTVDNRTAKAHRVSYEVHVGPVPPGLELDHLCSNRACVRPDHLEAVTHAENVRRGGLAKANAARGAAVTSCKRGHPFDDANTIRDGGRRRCRTCHNTAQRERNRAARAARRVRLGALA